MRNAVVGYTRPLTLRFESLQRIRDNLNRFNDLLCRTFGCGAILASDIFRIHNSLKGSAESDNAFPNVIRRPPYL